MDDQVRRIWDGNAEVWARHQAAGYDVMRASYHNPAFFQFVGDLAGQLVLDAGCGAGITTREMARQGMSMVGVDIAPRMIELAREAEQREPLGIRYEEASLSDLSAFADATFDAALSTMVIMDCADYAGAAREICRVLKPGGLFAFTTLHPCFIHDIRGWEYDEAREAQALTIGPYLDERTVLATWRFAAAPASEDVKPFDTLYFNRTMSTYLNTLIDAGLTIAGVAEPAPTDEACREQPRLRKYQKIPHILCVKARKPAAD